MNFFQKIKNSIYSPSFYSEISQKTLGSAFGYFFLLILLLMVIRSIQPIYTVITDTQPKIKEMVNSAKNFYPKELVVKIKDGKVTTNVEEPYFIPFPFGMGKEIRNESSLGKFYNLVVIDTQTSFSPSQFDKYESAAWLTKDAVYYKSSNRSEFKSLSDVSDITINKALIDNLIDKVIPWLKFINPVFIVIIVIGFYIAYISRLVYLFFLAFLIWLLTKILKKSFTYGQSYKIGLYAMTTGFIAELLLSFTNFRGFFCMFTIITLIMVAANLQSKEKTQTETPTKIIANK